MILNKERSQHGHRISHPPGWIRAGGRPGEHGPPTASARRPARPDSPPPAAAPAPRRPAQLHGPPRWP